MITQCIKQRSYRVVNHRDTSDPIRLGKMHDERIETRPGLRFKDFQDRRFIQGVGSEAVNRFRGQRDYLASPQ